MKLDASQAPPEIAPSQGVTYVPVADELVEQLIETPVVARVSAARRDDGGVDLLLEDPQS